MTREEAFALLQKYNKDPFHIQHALTVEAVMKWYANELGYGDDAEYWGIVGVYALLTSEEVIRLVISLFLFKKRSWMVSLSDKKTGCAPKLGVAQTVDKPNENTLTYRTIG